MITGSVKRSSRNALIVRIWSLATRARRILESRACQSRMPAPLLHLSYGDTCLSDHAEADWRGWLYRAPEGDLVIQILH